MVIRDKQGRDNENQLYMAIHSSVLPFLCDTEDHEGRMVLIVIADREIFVLLCHFKKAEFKNNLIFAINENNQQQTKYFFLIIIPEKKGLISSTTRELLNPTVSSGPSLFA